jgi:hypothetical protein
MTRRLAGVVARRGRAVLMVAVLLMLLGGATRWTPSAAEWEWLAVWWCQGTTKPPTIA